MGNTAALKRYIQSGANVESTRTGYTGDHMIPFNAPPVVGTNSTICSRQWVAANCAAMVVYPSLPAVAGATFWQRQSVTEPSCTASLEMAALLLDIQPGVK